MPINKDIKKVMVIGSGPIVIGQAAEFDYAGTQACRVLKDAGLDVVLVNSNPATIMTDKALADAVARGRSKYILETPRIAPSPLREPVCRRLLGRRRVRGLRFRRSGSAPQSQFPRQATHQGEQKNGQGNPDPSAVPQSRNRCHNGRYKLPEWKMKSSPGSCFGIFSACQAAWRRNRNSPA